MTSDIGFSAVVRGRAVQVTSTAYMPDIAWNFGISSSVYENSVMFVLSFSRINLHKTDE